MKRIYESILKDHLTSWDQMVFMSGPRQAGKTTLVKNVEQWNSVFKYYNWDKLKDREQILNNSEDVISELESRAISGQKPILAFDEIHKYKNWKNYIKGIYDSNKEFLSILVTGSARLNIYKQGQDSLMGRYFLYRIHPFSVGEILDAAYEDQEVRAPKKVSRELMDALFEFGGFPDPFIKQDKRFFNKWHHLRNQQLFREDLKDISRIYDISLMEVLAVLLRDQSGQLLNYTSLSKKVRVSDVTIRKWISVLEELHYCFRIKPWHKNITRSLIKDPKIYLWDWSKIEDIGSKVENLVASHLLKAVHFWTDTGLGVYELYYLRDIDKREVDFLITKNHNPFILIEVKRSEKSSLSSNLIYFQEQIKASYALQLAYDMDYVDIDFRDLKSPKIFPVSTFLSQLP